MKRLLLLFSMVIAIALMATAEEKAVYTCSFSSSTMSKGTSGYGETWTNTCGSNSWTMTNFHNNNKGWEYVKCGHKTTAYVASIATDFKASEAINKIVVTLDAFPSTTNTLKNVNGIYLYISDNSDFINANKIDVEKPSSKGDLNITIPNPTSDKYYKVVFDCAAATTGLIQLSKLVYYADVVEPTDNRLESELIFADDAVTLNLGTETIFDFAYAGDKVNPVIFNVESSDPTVASVILNDDDETITVKALAKGKTTITLKALATVDYKATSATMEISVIDPNAATDQILTGDSFTGFTNSYKWYTASSDFAEIKTYGYKNAGIQWNIKSEYKSSGLIVNTNAGYQLVSISIESNYAKDLKLYTSDTAYSEETTISETSFLADLTTNKTSYTFDELDEVRYIGVAPKETGAVVVTKITLVWKKSDTRQKPGIEYLTKEYFLGEGETFTTPELQNPNKLAVNYSSSNESVATVATDGTVTINGIGEVTITAESVADDTYKIGRAKYTINIYPVANTISEFISKGKDDENLEIMAKFDATVTYANGSNTYITDNVSAGLIYMAGLEYVQNAIIPQGWIGTVKLYNGFYEIINIKNTQVATTTAKFTPTEYALTDITADMLNEVVNIKLVGFGAATASDKYTEFKGKLGENELSFKNYFGIESVVAGNYSILGAVSLNGENPIIYPIEYTAIIPSKPIVNGEENNGESIKLGEDGKVEIEFFPIEGETVYYKHVAKQVNTETTEDDTENAPRKVTDENGFEEYVPGTKITIDSEGDLHHYSVINGIPHETNILAVENGGTTSLTSVAAEGVEAEYFDLMGRKVVNPAQGSLVIERKGSEVRKVIVK